MGITAQRRPVSCFRTRLYFHDAFAEVVKAAKYLQNRKGAARRTAGHFEIPSG
jgi:hypothetical protein